MPKPVRVERFGEHGNAFGFLRLLFASVVIASHTPDLMYGGSQYDPIHRLSGTMTFGGLAVDGFFLISGFLITGSYLKNPRPAAYLAKRVKRIVPGFVVAALLSATVFAMIGGASVRAIIGALPVNLVRALALREPMVAGAFTGSFYTGLNGAMWTIAYEFRCYLLVLALGVTGLLVRRGAVLVLAVVLLALADGAPSWLTAADARWPAAVLAVTGLPGRMVPLAGVFLVGALGYLEQARIKARAGVAAAAATLLVASLLTQWLEHVAIAVLGGYLVYVAALSRRLPLLHRINNREDISYGTYLYGFPIEQCLIWIARPLGPWAIGGATWVLALALGAVSWRLVEKPAMRVRLSAAPAR